MLHLKLGTHRLKFIVDGEWRCSNELETALDVHGNLVNYIEVKAEGGVMDILGQTAVSAMSLTASGRAATLRRASVQSGTECMQLRMCVYVYVSTLLHVAHSCTSPLVDDYCQDVPFYLASKPAPSTTASSQDSVTRDAYLRSFQGGAASVPSSPGQPSSATRILSELSPLFPSQLDRIILNSHATPLAAVDYNQATLPVPNHVSLNHLFALSIKDGVMGVATTARFRKKYVSVVMYRPLVE